MARRSATNERYQKYTSPSGKTRKSAAAAKPKRAAGAAPASKSGKSSSTSKSERAPFNPPTREYKTWRNIWWGLLAVALVLTGGSWLVRTNTSMNQLSGIMLGIGYASIFAALYVDWTKLRPLRKQWLQGGREAWEKDEAAKAKAEKSAAKAAERAEKGSD